MGLDQTSWPDLEDGTLPPWQMWCLTAPGVVYHRICDDESATTFKTLMKGYRGGWCATRSARTRPALVAVPDHVWRDAGPTSCADFETLSPTSPTQVMLAWIADLHRIDEGATDAAE